MLIQFSDAHGPAECSVAVAHALRRFLREAEHEGIPVELVEERAAPHGLHSAIVEVKENANTQCLETARRFVDRWLGTIRWICPSPLRPHHPRKNWHIGVHELPDAGPVIDEGSINAGGIVFETFRASGPGGQHVNRTESAVRARHPRSGLSVVVESERS